MSPSALAHIFRTKPLRVIRAEENSQDLPRSLSLFDLLCIGIGGTVGSGIFATTGDIISGIAGPAAVLSWAIAGCVCVLNAFAYMELVTRVPSSGSTYAYAYHTLGELPAVIAAWLLTLEYAMSGAGVARSWAAKMEEWLTEDYPSHDFGWLNAKHTNLLAAGIMALSVLVLLMGVRFGKIFVNTITTIKLVIVAFIIIAGFALMEPSNLSPFIPDRDDAADAFGWQGVISGASAAFFGYVGFDEVCCLAAEAKNPKTVMPIAVISVVLATMALSVLSSLVLSGMIEYTEAINFSVGFRAQGADWAAKIVHAGETVTMPVVVLIAFLAQPRLNYALACDGLMPQIFAKVDEKGNLFVNTLISGIIFTVITFVVPFDTLWDIVNFGIFLNFVMTQSSLLVARTRKSSPVKGAYAIAALVACSLIAAFTYQKGYSAVAHDDRSVAVLVIAIVFWAGAVLSCVYIWLYCPMEEVEADVYRAPFVPFVPTISIMADFYMMAQLSALGLELSLAWIGAAIVSYFVYGYGNAAGRTGWSALLHYLPHLSASYEHQKEVHGDESFSAPMLEANDLLSPRGKAKLQVK